MHSALPQVPQYILEAAIEGGSGSACSIVCTQPRRIAAMSVAERVAAERGEAGPGQPGCKVGGGGGKGRLAAGFVWPAAKDLTGSAGWPGAAQEQSSRLVEGAIHVSVYTHRMHC